MLFILLVINYLRILLKNVVIVGAGPAGMFAAQELAGDLYNVTVVEKSGRVGGAGCGVDGKLNFHSEVGFFSDLPLSKLLPSNNDGIGPREVVASIKKTFQRFGKMDMYYDKQKQIELESLAAEHGVNFLRIEQGHIGSDKLPEVMNNFKLDLESKGVKFCPKIEVKDIHVKNNLVDELITGDGRIKCDYAILAPGRAGSNWLFELGKRHGLKFTYNPLDIGVRVEVQNSIMHRIMGYHKVHDPKFQIITPHGDRVRTFCVCHQGYVTSELYGREKNGDSIYGVNGHSLSRSAKQSDNTNFAFLATVGLTQPQEDTGKYGMELAKVANCLSGNKVMIQSVQDLELGRRSTPDRLVNLFVKPTYRDVTPGNIRMACPDSILDALIDGLQKLNKVVPGVYAESTLLYYPEIKFYARRYDSDNSPVGNLMLIGDGAGRTRGIVAAGADGIATAMRIKSLN
jgi:uncharacterized FAD-dependent dehydrogenase